MYKPMEKQGPIAIARSQSIATRLYRSGAELVKRRNAQVSSFEHCSISIFRAYFKPISESSSIAAVALDRFQDEEFKKSMTMNCQKCRTSLRLDSSLQDLNPAAFDLLVGSAGRSVDKHTNAVRLPYPEDRKDLYHRVSQDASSPTFKRIIPQARQTLATQPAVAASTKPDLKDNPAMSFVMLTDSQVVPPQPVTNGHISLPKTAPTKGGDSTPPGMSNSSENFSHSAEMANRLFEILSARSDIDHPICTECTDLLLASLADRHNSATKERDAYVSFLKSLKNNAPTANDISKAQSALKSAQDAEAKAFSDLVSLENEKAALEKEIAELEAQSMSLDLEEQEFWRSRNAFALKLSSFQNERDALNAAYDHDTQQLERLQRTNVYNDTFCIGHDGYFGTINGLRLGRLPAPQNVDWSEINAAWGNAALLLATVAEKLGFAFKGYRVRPMGSTSKIEKIEYPPSTKSSTVSASTRSDAASPAAAAAADELQPKITSLDLFSSGDLPIGRMLLHRRLDAGMVAFLECLRQLGEFVHASTSTSSSTPPFSSPPSNRPSSHSPNKTRPSLTDRGGGGDEAKGSALPYRIRKDKIDDVSIKLGTSTDEAWTRACKYTLTCCKFLLAHASNTGGGAGGGGRRGAG
ncbi:MAG: hypothetical protein Q9191_007080 [Dirinaria sp. TL-2023a]